MEKLTKALMTDETGQAIVTKLTALSGQMHELAMATRGSAILFESESDISVLGDGGYLAVYVGSTNPLEISEWTGDNSLVTGHLYYLIKSGTDVASSDLGEYGGTAVTDTTLELPNVPADSETVGLAFATKADADDLTAVQTELAGKADSADIESLAEDIAELQDGGYVADQQKITEKINDWLEEHPEATTTVEDNSLTAKKLVIGTLGYVTPEDFGAKGDGQTDDTQALQACISAGNVLHLNGTYKISAGIELHSGLHIYGFGKGRIVKDENTQTHFAALYHYDTAVSDILIDGLTIVGLKHWTGSTISGTANDYGIRIQNAENVKILHNTILECGACAVSVNAIDCEIFGNTIKYSGAFTGNIPNYNFGIAYGGEKFVISDNVVSGVIQGILSGLNNKNVKITGNDISTNGQHGLYMEGAENVIVSGNTIHDCALCGVKFQRDGQSTVFKDITISDNIIENCGAQGILIVALTASATDDIYNVVISGNSIKDCRPCINTTQVSRCVIVGNVITNTTETYGISVNLCDDFTIASNRLYIAGADAIRFQNASDLSRSKNIKISDNYIFLSGTISGASPACIGINTGSNLMIVNNLCIADANSPYISGCDGIKLSLNEESTYNRYLIGNVAHGFRWDFRIVNNVNVVFVNNYYDRATGVPT